MTMIDVLAWGICIVLLALTIACQRPRAKFLQDLKYRDVAAFIPSWSFFAPNPGTTDTRVLWRERLVGGSLSPWHELLPPTGGALRGLWNPTKRQRKLLTDVGPMVVRMVMQNPKSEYTLISLPYLIMLHRVMSLPASPLVAARQFVVVQTTHEGTGEGELRPLFASRWHAVEHAGALVTDGPSSVELAATPELVPTPETARVELGPALPTGGRP
jgi:hypothetical protein